MNRSEYAKVVLLAAVITACGHILAAIIPKFWPAGDPAGSQDDIKLPNQSVESTKQHPSSSWQQMKAGVVYRAETNGFVSGYSGGNKPGEGVIRQGSTATELPWRTRFNHYNGAVLPVREGEYWMVEVLDDRADGVTVQWIATP